VGYWPAPSSASSSSTPTAGIDPPVRANPDLGADREEVDRRPRRQQIGDRPLVEPTADQDRHVLQPGVVQDPPRPDCLCAQVAAVEPVDTARLLRTAGLSPDEQGSLATAPPIELLEHLGGRWYRQAREPAPVRTTQLAVVGQVAERFRDARRILNHVTDRYLTRVGAPWFGPPGS
jgi:hypothetical protein